MKIFTYFPQRVKTFKVINFKMSNFKTILNQFLKITFGLRYRFHGRCWDANTFPARKRTLESNFLFLQISEQSFINFN